MYYQALVIKEGQGSEQLRYLAREVEELDIRLLEVGKPEANDLLLYLEDQGHKQIELPLVMVGTEILTQGANASVELLHHLADNPHVHWEAGNEDE